MQQGSTTEGNLADWASAARIQIEPVLFERIDQVAIAFVSGRCDALTTDVSQIAAVRSSFPQPADFVTLPVRISKEPLGPMVRRDDQEWFDVVRWTLNALVAAEEFGITAANAATRRGADGAPEVRRLLGADPVLGHGLKLSASWAFDAIRAVGNYGNIRAQRRRRHPAWHGARTECPLDRWRADVRLANALEHTALQRSRAWYSVPQGPGSPGYSASSAKERRSGPLATGRRSAVRLHSWQGPQPLRCSVRLHPGRPVRPARR